MALMMIMVDVLVMAIDRNITRRKKVTCNCLKNIIFSYETNA